MPWQRWLAIHGLELLPDRTYRFRTVIAVVARQNGKSDLKRTITLWRMYMNPKLRVLGVAQELDLAKEQWQMCQDTIEEDPALSAEFDPARKIGKRGNTNGQEYFLLANGSRYKIKASNRRAGRGGSNDEVNIDELREMRDWKPWAAVSKTTMARATGQVWCMSNAGDDESVVLNQLRDSALSGRDPSIGIFEWSAAYDDDTYCDLDDWPQIAQANPGLGYIISARAIASAMSEDIGVYRTEVLCQRVRHIDAAIDMQAWAACADPAVTMDSLRNRLAVCLDVAEDGRHATLAVAARTLDGKVRGEIAASWNDGGQARRELPALLHRIRPCVVGWYPSGPAAELSPIFRAPDGRVVPLDRARPGAPAYQNLSGAAVTEACMGLAGLVKGRQVLHNDDPLLNDHAAAAAKLKVGDGWRFARRQTGTDPDSDHPGHVDAAYAFAGAVDLALKMPEPRRARVRLLA
jgi:hypothetical protein